MTTIQRHLLHLQQRRETECKVTRNALHYFAKLLCTFIQAKPTVRMDCSNWLHPTAKGLLVHSGSTVKNPACTAAPPMTLR